MPPMCSVRAESDHSSRQQEQLYIHEELATSGYFQRNFDTFNFLT